MKSYTVGSGSRRSGRIGGARIRGPRCGGSAFDTDDEHGVPPVQPAAAGKIDRCRQRGERGQGGGVEARSDESLLLPGLALDLHTVIELEVDGEGGAVWFR